MATLELSKRPPFRFAAMILSAFCLGYGLLAGFGLRAFFASPWFVVGFIVALGLGVQLTRIAAWGMAEYPTYHHRQGVLLVIFGLQSLSTALFGAFGFALFQWNTVGLSLALVAMAGFVLTGHELRRYSRNAIFA